MSNKYGSIDPKQEIEKRQRKVRSRSVIPSTLVPAEALLDRSIVTAAGYEFIAQGKPLMAVGLFRLLAEDRPSSATDFDSLADAYMAAGDKAKVPETYRKILVLLPLDGSLDANARKQLEENALRKLNEKR